MSTLALQALALIALGAGQMGTYLLLQTLTAIVAYFDLRSTPKHLPPEEDDE